MWASCHDLSMIVSNNFSDLKIQIEFFVELSIQTEASVIKDIISAVSVPTLTAPKV